MSNGVEMERFCPVCDETISFDDHQITVTCPNPDCQTEFLIEPDAEFVDGLWRNRTQLIAKEAAK